MEQWKPCHSQSRFLSINIHTPTPDVARRPERPRGLRGERGIRAVHTPIPTAECIGE